MSKEEHVKFIEYTGEWPNLCRGVLTLEIDGKEVKFGHDYSVPEAWKNDGNYDDFWASGGDTWFTGNFAQGHTDYGEWIINKDNLPKEYQKYYDEISEVFNDNVESGCCGGCL